MLNNVCVYCSSSNNIDDKHFEAARTMGRLLAEREYALVYGGGDVGLMGALARSVHEHGGTVCGVIPEALKEKEGVAYEVADELITTQSMQERKAEMYRRAHAFVALPGGFGTLEEFMEILTLKQLGYHDKALVLVNANGFYDPLLGFFEQLHADGFAHKRSSALYHVAETPREALDFVKAYDAPPLSTS